MGSSLGYPPFKL